MTRRTSRPLARVLLLLLALRLLPLFSSCVNYRLGSMLPADIRTVHVPTCVNRTTEPFIEQDATSAILSAIQMDGSLRVVPREDADSILDITLTEFWLDPVSYVSGEASTANEYRMNIRANIVLRRAHGSEVILERIGIVGYKEFDFTGDMTSSKAIALRPAAEDLGRRIVDTIVQYWP